MVGLTAAGGFMLASLRIDNTAAAVVVLAMGFAASDFILPNCWAVCLDIGKDKAGAVSGAMNTAGQAGGTIMAVLYGEMVERYGWSYPLIALSATFFIGAVLWLAIDPSKPLGSGPADPVRRPEAIVEG